MTARATALLVLVLALVAVCVGVRPALACPVCAAGEASGSGVSLVLMATFLAAPFVIGAVAALVIRRLCSRLEDER